MNLFNWYEERFAVTGERKRHQGTRERNRRLRQVMKGQLVGAGVEETRTQWEAELQLLRENAS
jgi:hypothetical protein